MVCIPMYICKYEKYKYFISKLLKKLQNNKKKRLLGDTKHMDLQLLKDDF